MPYEHYSCPNEQCEMHNIKGSSNITHRCWYGKTKDRELLYCKTCGATFSSERYTVFGHTKLPKEKFCQILRCLVNKGGILGTANIVGVTPKTVSAAIRIAAQHFNDVSKIMIGDLKVSEVQMDEFWSFIKKKEKHATEEEKEQGIAGDRYTYVAMDAVSRLVISTATGRRIQKTADTMLAILKERISLCWEFIPLILFTSDAWEQYFIGLKKIFGFRHRPRRRARVGRRRNFEYYLPWNILYATVSKIKNGAGRVIRISRNIVHGYTSLVDRVIQKSSVSSTINTSFLERANGTFRSFCSRLVRKTYSFSRLASYHDAHVAIIESSYNFVHPHRTLTRLYSEKTTPAMAAGLTNHCWSIMELCSFPVLQDNC